MMLSMMLGTVGLSCELRDVTAATRRNGSSLTAKASERSKNVAIFGHFVARLGEIGPPVILGNQCNTQLCILCGLSRGGLCSLAITVGVG